MTVRTGSISNARIICEGLMCLPINSAQYSSMPVRS